jgi:hypothetical protein
LKVEQQYADLTRSAGVVCRIGRISRETVFFVKRIHTRMMIKLKTKSQQIVLERIRDAL